MIRAVATPVAMLTPPTIGRRFGVSPEKVLAWIASGELAAVDLASPGSTRSRWKISEEALAEFLARRAAKPEAKPKRRTKKEPYPIYV